MSDDDGKSSRDGIKGEEAPPELEVLVEAEAIFEGQLAPTVWEKTEENPTYDIHKKRFKNNFDIIRTFAAILVVYSHTYAVGNHTDWFGNKNDPLYLLSGIYTLGTLGVYIFFITSGYLIPKSAINSSTIYNYFVKRCLRIIPALFVVSALLVFIVGPLKTNLALIEYFTNWKTYYYLTTFRLYKIPYTLPGVFEENTINTINEPLWTLHSEFTCYIIVALLLYFNILRRAQVLFGIFIGILIFLMIIDIKSTPFTNFPESYYLFFPIRFFGGTSTLIFILFFFTGMIGELKEKNIKYEYKIFGAILLLYLFSLYNSNLNIKTPYNPKFEKFPIITLITLPYIILFLSKIKFKPTNNFSKYGDPSYGIYILHWPILQLLISTQKIASIEILFLTTLLICVPLSYCLWHYIEKRALSLKPN